MRDDRGGGGGGGDVSTETVASVVYRRRFSEGVSTSTVFLSRHPSHDDHGRRSGVVGAPGELFVV